jgi:hypothetical protein
MTTTSEETTLAEMAEYMSNKIRLRAEAVRYGVPADMVDGWLRYILDYIHPGDFGMAVLRNDLLNAFERADAVNARHMFNTVKFLYNAAPAACWGSQEKIDRWLAKRKVD